MQMKATRLIYLSIIGVFTLCASARGDLAWKQKTVQVKADSTQDVVEVKFPFANNGDKPVDIQKVESSCGCTTSECTQRHYEPGQSGEIVARYTIGSHVGTQRKTIAVKTNDQAEPTILTLVVEIPELVRISPAFVTWSQGEAKKAKKLTLETTDGYILTDVQLQSSNPAMQAGMTTLVKGHKYEITVTPGTTDHFVFSTLGLDCRFGKEIERTFRAYATVKPSGATQ